MVADAVLLEAWRGGDSEAGQQLVARHYASVGRFFASKIATDPADLLQETFLRCLQSTTRLERADRFRAFLFGIAYHVLADHLRESHGAGRFDPMSRSAADAAPGPGTLMAATETQWLLHEALRRIPLSLQVVLELFYWENMTSAEVAEVLGEPHGTVRTRLRRARQVLEQTLDDMIGDSALRATTRAEVGALMHGATP